MTTIDDKLREFEKKWNWGPMFIADLTFFIEECYYPKEFTEWLLDRCETTITGKWFINALAAKDEPCFFTTEEVFNYWKANK